MVAWLNVQFTQLLLTAIKSNKILCVRVRDSISDSGFSAALGPSGGLFPLSLSLGRSKTRDGECPGFLLFTLPSCIPITSAIPELFISKHFGYSERTWSPVFSSDQSDPVQCMKGSEQLHPWGDWRSGLVRGLQNCWRRDSMSKALETGSQQKASATLTDFWRAFLKMESISGCQSEETLGGKKWLGTDAARA